MANVKITELPSATNLGLSVSVPLVQSGVTKQATLSIVRYERSPMDFGAVGDGTTDDTTAVSNSLVAGDIFLPPGKIFKITSTVTVSGQRKIFGPGTLRVGANGISVLKLTVAGSSVEGAFFDNPSDFINSGGTPGKAIDITAANCQVIGCHFDGYVNAVWSTGANTVVNDNAVLNVRGVASEAMGDGIILLGAQSIAEGNTVTCKSATDARIGIVIDGGNQCAINGNTINGTFRRGIHVEQSLYSVVVGNTVRGITNYGIFVSGPTGSTCVIEGNFTDTPAAHPGPMGAFNTVGIYAPGTTDVAIRNNIVNGTGTAQYGILLGDSPVRPAVSGNIITGSASSMTVAGIAVILATGGTVVQGNTIKASVCSGVGIDVFTSPNSNVLGNHVQQCGSHGIRVYTASIGSIISNNVSKNNGGAGINGDQDQCIYVGNQSYDDQVVHTQTYGVLIGGTGANNTVAHNYFANNVTAAINDPGGNRFVDNIGYKTENNGTGTIASGSTSVTVTHGLGKTPVAADISVTPTANTTTDPGNLWVDTISSTQFNVNCRTNPGVSGMAFSWQARVL